MEDMMLEANEIQEVMSRSYGINDDIDEAELEAEFDALGNFSVWFQAKCDLGDDFLADNDSSYLDLETPNAPTANPAEETADTDEFGLPRIPEASK